MPGRFLDTNILLRFLTRDDEGKATASLALLTRIEQGEEKVVTSPLVALSDLERWTRLDQEREERSKPLEEVCARNADKTAEEVERDVAEELDAVRGDKRMRPAP